MGNRFIKIGATGGELAGDSAEWIGVLDTASGLTWSVEESKAMPWKKAGAWAAKLDLAGFKDWRLPTRIELLALVDDTRHSPSIDIAYFPGCKSEWYWTSTLAAYSPGDHAWLVGFSDGSSLLGLQSDGFRVRAARSSQ